MDLGTSIGHRCGWVSKSWTILKLILGNWDVFKFRYGLIWARYTHLRFVYYRLPFCHTKCSVNVRKAYGINNKYENFIPNPCLKVRNVRIFFFFKYHKH